MSVNNCIFIGNVGQEPRIHQFDNGKVANLSIAISERYRDRQGQFQERTEWISVVVKNPDVVGYIEAYVTKGTQVYIETKYGTRKYTGNDGFERTIAEFSCRTIKALSGYKQNDVNYQQNSAPQPQQSPAPQQFAPQYSQPSGYQRPQPAPQPQPQPQAQQGSFDDDLPFN